MAYILAVHPAILATTGMDAAALVTSTALIAGMATLVVGVWTNFPLAMAPGMGLNAFFAFTLCGAGGMPWQAALAVVLTSGILFVILTLTPVRVLIIRAFPQSLRSGISAGIGAFLLFLGLKNAGIIRADAVTFIAGNTDMNLKLAVIMVAVLAGVWTVNRRVPGNLLLVILAVTLIGLFLPAGGDDAEGRMTALPSSIAGAPASIAPLFLQFDWKFLLDHGSLFASGVLTFLLVDIFDTTGTLVGIGHRSGAMDQEGFWAASHRAMKVDAASTAVGAAIGTSPVTTYIESCAGIEAGAKTGLASVVTGLCFLLSLWLGPLILSIPVEATAVALIVVGILMIQSLRDLNFGDVTEFFPAVVCVFLIPLTFSISHGIALGYLSFLGLSLLCGRASTLDLTQWILGLVFALLLAVGI
jgi:AGZA family xanthine/uracil permease-like MFS transporter